MSTELDVSKIKRRLVFGLYAQVVFVTLILSCFIYGYHNQKILENIGEKRHHSYLLADMLRQSSDDLTNLVRTYAATGDKMYKDQYYKVLDIRNGKDFLPQNYNRIYWDLLSDSNCTAPFELSEQKISLKQLMREADFTDKEFGLLGKSENNSNELVNLEERAMDILEGKTDTVNTRHLNEKNANRYIALDILYSPEYRAAKRDIMRPINAFFASVEERTNNLFIKQSTKIRYVILILFIMFVLNLVNFFFLLFTNNKLRLAMTVSLKKEIEIKTKEITQSKEEVVRINKELKSSNLELEKANTTKDKLFSIIGHDLRSPISSLMNTAEMLADGGVTIGDTMKNTFIKGLAKNSKTIYNLLENLLSWSRNQIGSISFEPENFDISDKVDEIFMFLKSQAKLKSIELINNIDLNTVVNADINMVEVIIRNLVSNAIKFTNELGRIEVGCSRLNGFLEIYVKDNGIGMDEEILKNIFDPHIFKTRSGTNKEPGTGLGLKLVREFIIKNKGDIRVESKVDIGSTFFFTLPVNKMLLIK